MGVEGHRPAGDAHACTRIFVFHRRLSTIMPKINDDIVRAVTDAARIEDIVGDFVHLRKAGVNFTGICPFHDDQHDGNFIVRPSTLSPGTPGRNTYHCFVCMRSGEGGGAVDFLMKAEHMTFPDAIRYLGRKYCIPVDDAPIDWTPPPPKPTPPPLPDMAMDRLLVKDTTGRRNTSFLQALWALPWNEQQRKELTNVLWLYCLGGWTDGRVCFWYIDHEGVPRSAKLMYYDGIKRDKTRNPGWLYNQDGVRQLCKPDEHTILKPLFGAHLLKRYPNAVVNVVESEKTAIIMSAYYGNLDSQLWLACGGLSHMNLDAMQVLIDQGRKVWLWPDKDGIKQWREVADKLGSHNVQVYTKFFDACWREEDGPKADAADIAMRLMIHPETKRTAEPKSEPEQKHIEPPQSDEPFIDPEEMADPRLHWMRQRMRDSHRPNFDTSRIPGTKTVGEILQEHPMLKPLLEQ